MDEKYGGMEGMLVFFHTTRVFNLAGEFHRSVTPPRFTYPLLRTRLTNKNLQLIFLPLSLKRMFRAKLKIRKGW